MNYQGEKDKRPEITNLELWEGVSSGAPVSGTLEEEASPIFRAFIEAKERRFELKVALLQYECALMAKGAELLPRESFEERVEERALVPKAVLALAYGGDWKALLWAYVRPKKVVTYRVRCRVHGNPKFNRARIVELIGTAGTLKEVSDAIGCTRERVRQVRNAEGITAKDMAARRTLKKDAIQVRACITCGKGFRTGVGAIYAKKTCGGPQCVHRRRYRPLGCHICHGPGTDGLVKGGTRTSKVDGHVTQLLICRSCVRARRKRFGDYNSKGLSQEVVCRQQGTAALQVPGMGTNQAKDRNDGLKLPWTTRNRAGMRLTLDKRKKKV